MTGEAIAIADWFVNILLFREVVVTIITGVLDGLLQQAFEIRRVRRVTIQTVARLDRLVFEFEILQRVVVARQAQRVPFLQQKIFVLGLMRVVATRAIAAFDRLMLYFLAGEKIFVAVPAKLWRLQF